MQIKLGVVMDPIASIHYKKDSTLAMLWEAEARGCELYYFQQQDLFWLNGQPYGKAKKLTLFKDENKWFNYQVDQVMPLDELQVILMRKDPPVDSAYIYTTYLLEHAERLGVLVLNRPQSLRDANEKLFATYFSHCMPPTLVTQTKENLHAFLQNYQDIVCKPLNSMGGAAVFRLKADEVNANVIFETLTQQETMYIMAQQYIPDIKNGDKRILMINGEPLPVALARIPQGLDWRGNMAVGAKGKIQALTERDQFICDEIGPVLRERGLYFVGLDVIGDYLTEINVTSPTGIREIENETDLHIAAQLFDFIEQRLS